MKIFQPMFLDEAKKMYEDIKKDSKGKKDPIYKILLNDIWFFTNGLTKDY